MKDRHGEFRELTENLLGAVVLITKLFAQLPVPIELPPLEDPETGRMALGRLVYALETSRTVLIPDQPLSDDQRRLADRMVLDWFAAHEFGYLIMEDGMTDWRIDGMDYALHRAVAIAYELAEQLGADIDP